MSKDTATWITYDDCDADKCIKSYNDKGVENGYIEVYEYGEIVFFNGLHDGSPAQIKFFKDKVAKKGNTPISEFCKGNTGNSITVTKIFKCKMTQPEEHYLFSVTSPGYKELDPVIIIEDLPFIFGPLVIIAVGVITLLLGLFAGKFAFGK